MVLELVERTCSKCQTTEPEVFFPRRSGGSPNSWCHDCKRQAHRDYVAANHERERVKRNAAHARRMQDPEYRERRRIYERERARLRRATEKGRKQIAAASARYNRKPSTLRRKREDRRIALRLANEQNGKRTNRSSVPPPHEKLSYLPAQPFVAWLQHRIERTRAEVNPWGVPCSHNYAAEIALRRLAVEPRSFFGWRTGERKLVHINVVDRAVLRDGSAILADVYPELGA